MEMADCIRHWWRRLGKARYPGDLKLHITVDCGGSNGIRARLRKVELQKLASAWRSACATSRQGPVKGTV